MNKGQGSVEYLMILAMVLIVALIAVILLGGIPVGSDSAMDAASLSYWQSTRPFQIVEWAQYNDTLYISMINSDTRRLILSEIQLGNVTANFGSGVTFSPGTRKVINISGLPNCTVNVYDAYEYDISILFDSNEIAGQRQTGVRGIAGRCMFA